MSSEGNSGLFGMMAGLIILVMAGVGFSLLVDRRFQFSSHTGEMERTIAADAENLAGLTSSRDRLKSRLADSDAPRRQQLQQYEEVRSRLAAGAVRLAAAKDKLAALKTGEASLSSEYAGYRGRYRSQTWEAASGEQLPSLTLRGGRRYEKVTITRVTPAGLEIIHADGRARIEAADLDAAWQDRFQWNDAERQALLAEEQRNLASLAAPAPARPPEIATDGITPADAAVADEQVQKLRIELLAWNQKVSTLSMQHSEALSHSGSSEHPSVPGSLETWAARSSRLSGELSAARTNQRETRKRLRALAPEDPLLKPEVR